ncbi:unnamed protein product [Brassica oleracea]
MALQQLLQLSGRLQLATTQLRYIKLLGMKLKQQFMSKRLMKVKMMKNM